MSTVSIIDSSPVPTVYVVENDRCVRESLRELIVTMGLREECYETGESFLRCFNPANQGCLILDMWMPGMTGIDVQEALIRSGYSVPVIIVTGHGDISACVWSVKHGAVDYLEKPYRPQVLRDRIQEAIEIDREQRQERERDAHVLEQLRKLTDDEMIVLRGIVSRKSNRQIAEQMGFSVRTVQFRRSSLMRKLGAADRAQLMDFVSTATSRRLL